RHWIGPPAGPPFFPYTTLFRSESTDAGWARILFSDTSAAALTWAIMKPELSPLCGAKNGGSPLDSAGLTSCSMRRSLMLASSARSEEHTSELQSRENLVCRLLL